MVEQVPKSLGPGNLQRLRALVTDTLVYGAAAAVSKSFALILFPFLTRNMSVADYGRFDLALYAALLLGLLIVWGQDSAVARLFFEDEEREKRQQIISQALLVLTVNFLLALLALLVVLQTSFVADAFGEYSAEIILLLLFYSPISGVLSFCQSILKWTFERNRYVLVALGVPASNLAIILLFARFGGIAPVTALGIMAAVGACYACLAIFFIRRWLVLPRHLQYVRALVPLALPYGMIACIAAVVPLFERAVITEAFGGFDLGLYAAAAKIASIAMLLSIAFQMGWGPFSYSIYKQPDAGRTYTLVLRAFSLLMCLAVLAISAMAEPLTRLLAGPRYAPAAIYVFPIAMAFGVQAIGWITEIGIHLSKKIYLNLVGFSLFLAVSLGGILYLSQTLGIIGVAIGALAGQSAMAITSAVLAQKAFPLGWNYRLPALTVVITLASGAGAVYVALLEGGAEPWWLYIGGMALIVAINFAGISREDRRKLAGLSRFWGRARSA